MTASAPSTGVRVQGLRKSFGKHAVLRGIDIHIAPGEVVGLIGPNGAGKTTLMSCLLGFLFADDGEVTIDGQPNDDLAVRRRTGFVPERMNFDRRQRGGDFLRYMALLSGVPRSVVNARVEVLMARLGIGDAADKQLSQYSRGMLQRIGLCQALAGEPDYLFLDEPTSGLDPNGVFLVRDVITEQKRRGAAVLLNSHQLSEVEKVCDRVFFLSGGVIARHETLRDERRLSVAVTLLGGSFDATTLTSQFEGSILNGNILTITVASEAEIADSVRRLVATGAGVIDVRRHAADLEGMFRGAQ